MAITSDRPTDLDPPDDGMVLPGRRRIVDPPNRVDRIFARVTSGAGIAMFVLLGLIALFLVLRSQRTWSTQGLSFLTTVEWRDTAAKPAVGVAGLAYGTVIVAVIAVLIAVPVGAAAGLFITEYARPRLRRTLTSVIDLLAAIPSLLYGIWGFLFLSGQIAPLSRWLTVHLSWIPVLRTGKDAVLVGSFFIAGIVVSLMVLPITASVTREVFGQAPPAEKEAALALGSTRWGMIRTVVIPYGRGGIVGGAMLGLGRALGETIAVALLLPQVPEISIRFLQNGGATISGFIAQRAGGNDFTVTSLMAAGLVLFVLTLLTNLVASVVISKSRSGAGVEA